MGTKWQCHSFHQGVSTPRQEEAAELDDTPKEPPHCRQKEGRSIEKPSLKSENLSGQLGKTTTRHTGLTTSMRGHMTSLLPSGTWLPLLTSWALRSMRCGRCGLARKTSGPLTAWPKLPPRTSASLGSCHPPNHPKSWA